jgi:lycopene beta-cyclase
LENNPANRYHYIITGAGCAGLSLLMHFIASGKFADKKILLIDRSPKNANDRTWCFWETNAGLFEPIVKKEWRKVSFYADDVSRTLDIAPYRYKMIRGIDFYQHCFNIIAQQKNIDVLYETVERIDERENFVVAGGRQYYAQYIFNSILFQQPQLKPHQFYLLQHFRGWLINTGQPVFDGGCATLMDFRVSQRHGTAFTYVLPLSEKQAMVEYTLFTKDLLEPAEYDQALREYIGATFRTPYTVTDEETGVIPMTNYAFSRGSGNVVNIGTAGGQTKPSSGYTFYFIQQHSAAITAQIIRTGKPFTGPLYPKKFSYYDSVLLNVLATEKLPGHKVFADLFRKNKPAHILQFLNNESALATDLRIISSLPTLPFLRAGIQEISH